MLGVGGKVPRRLTPGTPGFPYQPPIRLLKLFDEPALSKSNRDKIPTAAHLFSRGIPGYEGGGLIPWSNRLKI